jgi:hypothetical protein
VARSNETNKILKERRAKKAQSALEYLIIYAWAILIAAVVIVVIYFFIFAPSSSVPSSCIFSSGAYCQDVIFGSNSMQSSLALLLTNTQDYAIANIMLQVNSSSMPSMTVKCSPSLVLSGGDIFCILTASQQAIAVGSLVSGSLQLSAVPCPSKNLAQCQTVQRQTYTGSFTSHVAPLTSLSSSTVTLSAHFQNPAANGATDLLTASVRILGTIIPGATVSFTQTNTFSTLNPTIATTDSNGNAESYVSSSQIGYTLVTASFAGATNSMLIDFTAPATVVIMAPAGACNPQTSGTAVLTVNSVPYTCSQFPLKFHYQSNSQYSYSFLSPIAGTSGTQYVFSSAGGCGATSLTGIITAGSPGSNCTVTSNFNTQYYLTLQSSPSGSSLLSPQSNWFNSGSVEPINTIAIPGNIFSGWSGTGPGSYTGPFGSNTVTMQGPITENAIYNSGSSVQTTFTETGLPFGQAWNVVYSGVSNNGVQPMPSWNSATNYPGNYDSTSCVQYGGDFYCLLGNDGGNQYNSIYYSIIQSGGGFGSWTRSYPNYPSNGVEDASCVVNNNYVYCVGGWGHTTFTSYNDLNYVYYAPISATGIGSWTATNSYPVQTDDEQCVTYKGYIYCVGGSASTATPAYYAQILNNGVSAWTLTNTYLNSMEYFDCDTYNGYIYCGGGATTSGTGVNFVYYAPLSSTGIGTWASVPYPNPNGSTYLSCDTTNGYIYCIGGGWGAYSGPTPYFYYAPLLSTGGLGAWQTGSAYPVNVADMPCDDYGGYLYCIGGWSDTPPLHPTWGVWHMNSVYYTNINPANAISLTTASGSYSYTIPNQVVSGSTYIPNPSSGTVAAGSAVNVMFTVLGAATSSTSTTSTSTSTTSTTSTVLPASDIYCVGTNGASPATGEEVYYAPISSTGIGTWTYSSNHYPIGIAGAGCSIYNGYIYCVGSETNPDTQVYFAQVLNPDVGSWTATNSFPVAFNRAGCSAYNGYIYCIGNVQTSPLNTVYYASLFGSGGVGSWALSSNSYPVPMERGGCSVLNSNLYCVGTSSTGNTMLVYYAPILANYVGGWTATNSYPVEMDYAGCSIYDGYIYCVGGTYPSGDVLTYYAPVFSSGVGTWTRGTNYPLPMTLAGCTIYSGTIYCVGNGAGPNSANVLAYYAPISNPGIGSWTATTSYPVQLWNAWCEISGTGGGFMGGGGPSSGTWGSSIAYVPITLTNSQTLPTPSPFQQMLTIDSQIYSSYINPTWNNVEFTTGPAGTGSTLQAWVESNPSNTATNTMVWVNIPNGIAASSSNTIYMDFIPTNVMTSSSSPTGEAPQLSGTYAQYDNGGSVFGTLYQNFAGTSTPSGWSLAQTNSILSINNGASFVAYQTTLSGTGGGTLLTNSQFGTGNLIDAYEVLTQGTSEEPDPDAYIGFGAANPMIKDWNQYYPAWQVDGASPSTYTVDYFNTVAGALNPPSAVPHVLSIFIQSATSASFSYDYGSYDTVTSSAISLPLNFGLAAQSGCCNSHMIGETVYWIRARSYPPNGVMPSVTYGGVV